MARTESLRRQPAIRSFFPSRTGPYRRRVGAGLQRAWRNYWRRRAARATLVILHSLDDRTLKDIGMDRSEIESVVCAARDRRIWVDSSDGPRRSHGICGCR
jgi:uncharacterized protein YjiS (DUF1127 family)